MLRYIPSIRRAAVDLGLKPPIDLASAVKKILIESFHRLRSSIGVDRAVFYSIVSRAFSTAGSLITLPLILTRLTSVEQGFYYTFGNILALQVFLEMGFGQVAVQMVAHEAAHLKIDLKSGISGQPLNLDRFSATVRFVRNWYIVVSILVGVFLLPAGYWFFSTSAKGTSAAWLGPWILLALGTAGNLFVRSLTSLIEGMGAVAESIRVNMWAGAVQVLLTIAGLTAGLRLYAVPLASIVALIVSSRLVWQLLRIAMRETKKYERNIHIDWIKEVFPYQWRIALSWISGWFIFNAMMPVVFRQLGPEEAGRFGLAMGVSNFINIFAMNWSSTKSAVWGQMASRKEWRSMDSLFWRVMPQSVGIAALASVAAIFFVPHLAEWFPRFSGRVPDWRVLFMLCAVTVMNQVVFAEAFYLRAHRREPLLASSIFCGAAMAIGLFCFSHSSAFSIAAMYAILTLIGGLILVNVVFVYCRSRWHFAGQC